MPVVSTRSAATQDTYGSYSRASRRGDQPHRDTIGAAPVEQPEQRRHLLLGGGHHELAADIHRDAVVGREVPHRAAPAVPSVAFRLPGA